MYAIGRAKNIAKACCIIKNDKRNGLELKTINDEGADFVRNWESEKYRKSLLYNKK